MALDIGTSVQGFLWLAQSSFPALSAQGLPTTIWEWGPLFSSTSAQLVALGRRAAGEVIDSSTMQQTPVWASQAWLILIVMSAIALGSERLLRWSYRRLREVLDAR